MAQGGVGVKHFTGRPVYEALVLGNCHDNVSGSKILHSLPDAVLVMMCAVHIITQSLQQ